MLIVRFALNRQVFSLAYSLKTETAENSLASHFEILLDIFKGRTFFKGALRKSR